MATVVSTTKISKLRKQRKSEADKHAELMKRKRDELRKMELAAKSDKKEYAEMMNEEEKNFYFLVIRKLGFSFNDRTLVIGSLLALKNDIEQGVSIDKINKYIDSYKEFASNPENGIEDDFSGATSVEDIFPTVSEGDNVNNYGHK